MWGGVAYDPDADLVYVGTGQPGPWTEFHRGPGDDWDYDSIADLMLADLTVNGTPRKVILHARKDGFFYVLDRLTGELLSADPYVTVRWASGVNLKTGRPVVNPEARYGKEGVSVMPGPGGGHVCPPWSYNPSPGLVYIPSTIGAAYHYAADPDYKPIPTDIGPTGRGQMNMGTAFGAGGGRGGAGRGASAVTAPEPAPQTTIPSIGPAGRGNVMIAWDPIARKEKWRGLAAGFNQGGTLSTAGNLVFSSVNTRLLVYRADTGDQLLDLPTGLSPMGPPMTFMIDDRQYVAVAGGPPQAAGSGRGGRGADTPAGVVRCQAQAVPRRRIRPGCSC